MKLLLTVLLLSVWLLSCKSGNKKNIDFSQINREWINTLERRNALSDSVEVCREKMRAINFIKYCGEYSSLDSKREWLADSFYYYNGYADALFTIILKNSKQ